MQRSEHVVPVEFTRLHAREGDAISTLRNPAWKAPEALTRRSTAVAWLPFFLEISGEQPALVTWFAYHGVNGHGVFTSWDTSPEARVVLLTGFAPDSEAVGAMYPDMHPTPGLTAPERLLKLLVPRAEEAMQRVLRARLASRA